MDLKDLEKLIRIFQDTDIDKLEWAKDGERLLLSKNQKLEARSLEYKEEQLENSAQSFKQVAQSSAGLPELSQNDLVSPQNSQNSSKLEKSSTKIEDKTLHLISAPFVGTFYRASSPNAASFVSVGDKVKKGDTLCIIEAMKLMNEIESDVDGTVVKIMIENAHSVEFGTILLSIEID